MTREYDLVVLGGGIGGYSAAIRAAQLGLKTALVEKAKVGGTCLHQGCIPTKSLLRSAEVYRTLNNADSFGITAKEVEFNFSFVQERKDKIVNQLHQGILHLMKRNKIDVFYGKGRLLGPSIFSPLAGTVSVEMNDRSENEILIGKNVILATGSKVQSIPGLEFDGNYILSSDDLLEMKELPNSILIVGGGVIGSEWSSLLSDFGVKVTIIEYQDRILPTEDKEISHEMTRQLKKKGISIITNAKIDPETLTKDQVVTLNFERNGKISSLEAEKMLVAIGRKGNIDDIGLENTDIQYENGFIKTNQFCQTQESHIYAIGDCIGNIQLAHVAMKEGIIAVEHIAGLTPDPIDSNKIPKCIYGNPEIASIGLTEDEAISIGYKTNVVKFPFKGIGKSIVFGDSNGFIKLIVDEKNDDLLGIHMIGPQVTELISEASLAIVFDAAPWEIASTIHPHPTLSEIFQEVALLSDGKAIHF